MKEQIEKYFSQADIFSQEEKYALSIDIYKKILELDIDNEKANFQIGELYHRLGNMTEALNYYLAVVEKNPDNTKANVKIEMINSIMNYFNTDMYNP